MKHIPSMQTKVQYPKVVHSLLLDDGFVDRLNRERAWTVHSTFRRVLNLISPTGRLITLASRDNTLMPYTAICSAVDFSEFSHLLGKTADVQAGELRIGTDLILRLDGQLVSSRYEPFAPLNDLATLQAHVAYLEQLYQQRQVPGSFVVKPDASRFERAMQEMLLSKTYLFRDAAVNKQEQAIIEHGRSLIGLGVGLTPSGDDYLVGFLAVLLLDKHCKRKRGPVLARAIVAAARQRTNEISATYLQSAARYRFKTQIADLVKAVLCQGQAQVKQALLNLIAVGATSGSDIARGMIDAFDTGNFHKGRT